MSRDGATPSTEARSNSGGSCEAIVEILSVACVSAASDLLNSEDGPPIASAPLNGAGGAGGSGGTGFPASWEACCGDLPKVSQKPIPPTAATQTIKPPRMSGHL